MSNGPKESLPTAELIRQMSEQVSRLIRDELQLAKLELGEKGKTRASVQGCSAVRGLWPCSEAGP
jgi:hypothetical protein